MKITRMIIVRAIVRGYFLAALYGSFHNLIHAGYKAGMGADSPAVPWMVDGVAVLGILMRHPTFSAHSRKVGMCLIAFGASLSLVGNVFAASNAGQAGFGAALVGFYLVGEILSGPKHLQPARVDIDREAAATAAQLAAEAAERKAAGIRKGQQTRRRNARIKAAETKLIDGMVNR
jgi:hypothetical protein